MPITRTAVTGTGNGTASIAGYPYVAITTAAAYVEYVSGGTTYSKFYSGERILVERPAGLASITIKAQTGVAWRIDLQSTFQYPNQTELKAMKDDTGYYFEGDDDVVFRGQGVDPATVDISGLPINMESLSQLYQEALYKRSSSDTDGVKAAARYCKMRAAVIANFKR